jgi:hypothetical protein
MTITIECNTPKESGLKAHTEKEQLMAQGSKKRNNPECR